MSDFHLQLKDIRSDTGSVVATDGSVRKAGAWHVGCAFLSDTGSWWLTGSTYRANALEVPHLTVQTELRAISAAVRRHDHPVRVLTDCREAAHFIAAWKAGDMRPVPHYYGTSLLALAKYARDKPDLFDVRWTPGHRGHALNEGADALARLASRYRIDRLTPSAATDRAAGIAEAFSRDFRSAA